MSPAGTGLINYLVMEVQRHFQGIETLEKLRGKIAKGQELSLRDQAKLIQELESLHYADANRAGLLAEHTAHLEERLARLELKAPSPSLLLRLRLWLASVLSNS